jgi:rSAM/selenodomain-associated transferase 1
MRVAVVLPARNEADALGQVLAELPRRLVHEILVVDNGSSDGTAEAAARGGARVVREPVAGYGRACLAGLAALDPAADVVVFLDADHADYAEELERLLEPIAQGRAELVIGSRTSRAQPGSLTWPQRVGNRLACALMRALFGARYTDLGPFRAIRREALARLRMRDRAFGWTVEMQAKAARLGLRVVEVPVRYRPRIGRSKISGTLSGTVRAGVAIISTILRIALDARRTTHDARRLLVFLKDPAPGRVKTRLAASLGETAAADAYRRCVDVTLERLAPLRDQAVLYVDPPHALARVASWLGGGWRLRPQRGADLGARLQAAISEAFAEGAGRVVVIGTDSPWLGPADIAAAFAALDTSDLVLGPAEDGGYYAIGCTRLIPELFAGIAWGSADVFAQTMAAARAQGVRVATLDPGYDIDRAEDLERWLAGARGGERNGGVAHA